MFYQHSDNCTCFIFVFYHLEQLCEYNFVKCFSKRRQKCNQNTMFSVWCLGGFCSFVFPLVLVLIAFFDFWFLIAPKYFPIVCLCIQKGVLIYTNIIRVINSEQSYQRYQAYNLIRQPRVSSTKDSSVTLRSKLLKNKTK